ncbi:MAG TPA: hypothetical protein VK644_03910 [Chitinophagaceae bacterium]|nr:hypothetical protein [Chitinophagaceae bacterium]
MENTVTPVPKPTPAQRFLRWLLKVLLWSFVFWGVGKLLKKVGWDGWDKFETSADHFLVGILRKVLPISPVGLYSELKNSRTIMVPDPDKKPIPEKVVKSYIGSEPIDIHYPAQPILIAHKVTVKEKIFAWCRGFWYTEDGKAFWFGRVLLALTLILSFVLSDKPESPPFFITFFQIWMVLLIGLGGLYVVLKLLSLLAGALTALFSSTMALGGYMQYVREEIKSEAIDHSKKAILPLMFGFFSRKK